MFIDSGIQSLKLVFNADVASMSSATILSTSSSIIMQANLNRKGLVIFNDDFKNNVYVAYDSTVSANYMTFQVPPQTSLVMPLPIYTGVISAIASAGPGVKLFLTELT